MSVHAPANDVAAGPSHRELPPATASLRAVVRHEWRGRRRGVLIWGGSLGAFGAFLAAVYPSIQKSIEQVAKHYPAGLKEAFGVHELNTVEGYIHAELFSLIVPLALGYFMIRAVATSTVGAEERGHLDTILALPISRRVLIVGTYVVAAGACAAVLAVIGVMTYISGSLAGTQISLGRVAAGVMGVWPLAVLAGGVAALAAGALHTARAVNGIALGTLVAMYALDLVARLAPRLSGLRRFSAFHYYGAPLRDGIDPLSFFGLGFVGMLLVVLGSLLLERRDILH